MNTNMLVSRSAAKVAVVLLAGVLAAGTAMARSNPIDPVSNPEKLDYSDVLMSTPLYDEPFQREGVMSEPERFRTIVAGLSQNEIESNLGQPLTKEEGRRGEEWNYNFTFLLPQSENRIVCQYKVIFDAAQQVTETFWRRHQCLDIVNTAAASPAAPDQLH